MGSLKGVDIQKGSTGPNAAGPDTSPSALISNATILDTQCLVNAVYELTSVADAEVLGITSEYDITYNVVLHRHIVDFYSMAGNGTSLRIMLTNAATPSIALDDVLSAYAKKLIIEGKGAIKQMAVCWNVPVTGAETIVDGMNGDIRAAIPKAQGFYAWAYSTNRPCQIVLEGRSLTSTLSAALDLRAITVNSVILDANKVSLAVGQDWDYAEYRLGARQMEVGQTAKVQMYADAGKLLGTISRAEINQSIAEVASFNLSNAIKGYYLTAGLSNHNKIGDSDASLEALDTKGYIFPIIYSASNVSGYRWNNDHVCCPIVIDDEGRINEHMIYYGRTDDYAAVQLRNAYLVRLKSRVNVDPETGRLPTNVRKNLEAEGDNEFAKMYKKGYITDGQTTIDPNSDLVTPPKSLLVSFQIVPTSILDNISGKINLVKSFEV